MQDKQTLFDQDAKNSPLLPDGFQENLDMQVSLAARRVSQRNNPDTATVSSLETREQLDQKRTSRLKRLGANALVFSLIVGPVAGLVIGIHESNKEPEFSTSTTTYVVEPGDGLQKAAEQVAGYDTVNIKDVESHIGLLPENQDTLADGLQPGDQLVIPESIKGFEDTTE